MLAPFQGAGFKGSVVPGVRKKRVPLAKFLAPLRGAQSRRHRQYLTHKSSFATETS
jgi:hypothetical protein